MYFDHVILVDLQSIAQYGDDSSPCFAVDLVAFFSSGEKLISLYDGDFTILLLGFLGQKPVSLVHAARNVQVQLARLGDGSYFFGFQDVDFPLRFLNLKFPACNGSFSS